MPRPREYEDAAARQAAYRQRLKNQAAEATSAAPPAAPGPAERPLTRQGRLRRLAEEMRGASLLCKRWQADLAALGLTGDGLERLAAELRHGAECLARHASVT